MSLEFSGQEYWNGLPERSSRGSFQPKDRTHISYVFCTDRWVLYHQHHLGSYIPLNTYVSHWLGQRVQGHLNDQLRITHDMAVRFQKGALQKEYPQCVNICRTLFSLCLQKPYWPSTESVGEVLHKDMNSGICDSFGTVKAIVYQRDLSRQVDSIIDIFIQMILCSVAQSCPFFATPEIVACQAPLFMEFSSQEYLSGLSFPSH